MAHLLADRVKETTTTTGTGTLSLAGAVTGFRAFSAVLANNDTTLYAISSSGGAEWEVGVGTWTTGNNLARTTILASSNAGAAVSLSAGTKDVFITLTPIGEIPRLRLAAGSATAGSWPTLASGTLLTTAEAGAEERDTTNFYKTTDAGNRGYVPVRHYIRCNTTRTLPNDTNLNAIFNDPTNGRLTLETGTYLFQGMVHLTSMSSTSGNALIDILGAGTATTGSWLWLAWGGELPLAAPNTISGSPQVTAASGASIVTASTATAMFASILGTVEVTAAGTVIPSIKLVTAAAAVVSIGSNMMFERIGTDSVVSVGQWD